MSGFHRALLSGSVILVLTHGAAMAQSVEADRPESTGLSDIVVTAQKSRENLQRTAAAVTAITSDVLVSRGVADLRDAQMVIPAARFQTEANNTQVFVRGVGSNLDVPNIEPTVAFNFNGTYMPREATSSAFFDVASMEVLPGPQGTLYGRGAMGGTVNVQFRRPEFNNNGSVLVEGGNYNLAHGTLAQNLELSSTLAVRVAVDYRRHDGYFTSGAEAADDIAGRFSILYEPNSNFSAYVWGFGAWKNGTAPNAVNHAPRNSPTDVKGGFLTRDPWDDVGSTQVSVDLANFLSSIGSPLPFTVGIARGEKNEYNTHSIGAEFKFDVTDNVALTYIPGYTRLKSGPYNWLGALQFLNTANIETHNHELRLSNDSGAVKWLAGLFYYHQSNSGYSAFFFGGPDFPNPLVENISDVRRNILKGEGAFAQLTWSASDRLRLIVGGRYSHDKREANGTNPEYRLPGQAPGTGPFTVPGSDPNWSYSKSFSSFDWKAAIEYDIAPKVMVYATAQTAHAPGTYNPISQAGLAAGDPFVNLAAPGTPFDGTVAIQKQKLTAFAGGFKSRIADNTLQVNVEGFYYDYRNLIQQEFDATKLFNPVFNAKKLQIYGFQADLIWKPTRNDTLNTSVGYTHARNKQFVTPAGLNFGGFQPPYSPDWTALGSYTHSFPIGNDASLDATVAGRYESSWFASFTHAPGTGQPAGGKLDASLTYKSGNGWQLAVWGKNLTNRAVLAAAAAAGVPGPAVGYLEAPRTYGLRFQIDY